MALDREKYSDSRFAMELSTCAIWVWASFLAIIFKTDVLTKYTYPNAQSPNISKTVCLVLFSNTYSRTNGIAMEIAFMVFNFF